MVKDAFMAIPLLSLLIGVIFLLLQEWRTINKKIKLLKRAEKNSTNMLYEYLYAKLVAGQCMDNSIKNELRCMSDEEIINVMRRGE